MNLHDRWAIFIWLHIWLETKFKFIQIDFIDRPRPCPLPQIMTFFEEKEEWQSNNLL